MLECHWTSLERDFFALQPQCVAPRLLNKILVHGERAGRIVEVEAYSGRGDDEASHCHRGQTERNKSMFGQPGLLYVYFTYGMHFCANAVCEPEGRGAGILIRAIAPVRGLEAMRKARSRDGNQLPDRQLCSGPAKLAQALGIGREHDGSDLITMEQSIAIVSDGTKPPSRPGRSERIGLSKARDKRWRWFVEGDPNLSRR